MRTESRKINAVVGLPDEHSFGADYLTASQSCRIYHALVMYSIGLGTRAIGRG